MSGRIKGLNIAMLTFLAAACAGAQTGSIAGSVTDANGAPVAGATVVYNNVREYTRDPAGHLVPTGVAINSGTITAQDGSFTVGSLPVGTYYLCAFGPQPTDLGSCEWGKGAYSVQIANAQAVANISISVTSGTQLVFQVSDPNSLIQDVAPNTTVGGLIPLSGGNFKIGVVAGGRYYRANPLSQTGTLHTYAVAVPTGVTLRLFVSSSLGVVSSDGTAIATEAASQAISITEQPQQIVSLTVQ